MILLLKIKLLGIKNRLRVLTVFESIRLVSGILLALFFMWLLYIASYRVLSYIQSLPLIGSLLVLKFLAISFLVTFVMTVFSSIILSLSSMFFSKDLMLLFSMPFPFRNIFLFKTFELTLQASWMVLLAVIPFLIAFMKLKSAGLLFFTELIILFIPFIFISCALGLIISISIMLFFPTPKIRDIMLVIAIILGSAGYLLFRFLEPEKLANPDIFMSAMQYIAYLNSPIAAYLPSWWLSEALNSSLINRTGNFLANSAYILATAAVMLGILTIIARKYFYSCWLGCQVNSLVRIKSTTFLVHPRTPFLSLSFKTLLNKDFTTFIRDTRQWSQLLLVFSLIAVYIFSLYRLPLQMAGTQNARLNYLNDFVGFINIGGSGFILTALALRFAFPRISFERSSLWLILSLPVDIKEVFYQKLFFSFLILLPSGFLLAAISNKLLKVSVPVAYASFFTIVLMSLVLTVMATGIGAIYPKFNIENTAQIEMSLGGIIYITCSFVYIGLVMIIISQPLRTIFMHTYAGRPLPEALRLIQPCLIELTALNAVAAAVPAYYGLKSMRNLELREWTI